MTVVLMVIHLRRNIVASMNYKILGNDNSVIDRVY